MLYNEIEQTTRPLVQTKKEQTLGSEISSEVAGIHVSVLQLCRAVRRYIMPTIAGYFLLDWRE